jgi:hypothetical protein
MLRARILALALLSVRALPFAALAGGVLAIGAVPAQAQTWKTYRDTRYSYQADFPGVPSITQQTTASGKVIDMAALQAGTDGVFLVTATENGDPLDPAQTLDKLVSGALEGAQGRLISSADVVVSGFPARDVVIRSETRRQTLRVRMVVRGSTFFQVMAVGELDISPPNADRFVKSFRFPPPPGSEPEKPETDAAIATAPPAEAEPAAAAPAVKTVVKPVAKKAAPRKPAPATRKKRKRS